MIRALLIDFDGVLRLWHSENDHQAEERTGLPPGSIRQVAFAEDILLPAITGRITDDDWRSRIVERLRVQFPQFDVLQAVRLWSASPGAIDHVVLEYIRRCRQNVPVVLMTNATSRLPHDLEKLALTHEFDHVINSSAVGAIKPQPAIFHAALRSAGTIAQETLFVDDSPGHVAAASKLGLHGHVYQSSTELANVLTEHGLI